MDVDQDTERMTTPAFEEIAPAADCDCAGCVRARLEAAAAPARPRVGARHALAVAATAG
ncbi:hypothetical protein GTW43_04500, partial [Streptomyces sp. SID5785]|nr:hypothetical protein [Streptomyces sp. SID5785]